MISHERLDRLAGQLLPRRAARRFADFANRRTAADYDTVVCTTGFAREAFDRIGATNTVTIPLRVDLETFHPSRRSALVRKCWATPGEMFTWQRAAVGMLSTLGAAALDDPGDSQYTA